MKIAADATMIRVPRNLLLDVAMALKIRPEIPDYSALIRSSMAFNEALRVRDNAIEDALKTLSAGLNPRIGALIPDHGALARAWDFEAPLKAAMARSRATSFASMESLAERMKGFHARQFREMAALAARNERVWGGMPTERGRPVADVYNIEDIAQSTAERTTARMLERERKWTSKEWLILALTVLGIIGR